MSQKLDLDYVERNAFSLSRLSGASIFVLVSGLASTVYVASHYQARQTKYTETHAKLQQVQSAKKATPTRIDIRIVPAEELKQVNETIRDLSTPWDQLLSSLEQIDISDIALLSLEPSVKKQQVKFGGQAKNMQATLNYVKQLESLPILSQVYLQNHNIDQVDPFKPVSFTIVAQW